MGAGHALKAQAGSELFAAVHAVVQGKQFVSSKLVDNAQHPCACQVTATL